LIATLKFFSVDHQEEVTDQAFGPFSVDPGQISELGVGFADFVNELLRVEVAAAGLDGGQLTTTRLVNVGDGGVDAGLHRAVATTHLPAGDSAWQFKAGDLGSSKCRAELRGGLEALDVLRGGGSYRLVLGKDLTAPMVRRRRKALEEEAEALGIEVRAGTFEVLNASGLAAWAGEHPALAVSPLLRGIGNVVQPFWVWLAQYEATGPWVDTPSRSAMIDEIRRFVVGSDTPDLHVEGVSGVGKTRVVLEAIRGQDFESLVAYVYAADVLPSTLIHHLQTQARHTILVVDECDAKSHKILVRQLRTASPVKLITIGEPTSYRGLITTVTVGPLEEDAVRRAVRNSQPGLQPEHARIVVDASAGNMRLAQLLAQQIVQQPNITVIKLIDKNIIGTYVSRSLLTGKDFLACCVLALLRSFGYDDEPSAELTVLADALELASGDLRAAARTLADAGLLSQQGRYRSVAPHPLAIYLATRAWEDFHGTIVTTLIPRVDELVAERLFRRAADCGEHRVTKRAAERLLAPGGSYERTSTYGTPAARVPCSSTLLPWSRLQCFAGSRPRWPRCPITTCASGLAPGTPSGGRWSDSPGGPRRSAAPRTRSCASPPSHRISAPPATQPRTAGPTYSARCCRPPRHRPPSAWSTSARSPRQSIDGTGCWPSPQRGRFSHPTSKLSCPRKPSDLGRCLHLPGGGDRPARSSRSGHRSRGLRACGSEAGRGHSPALG
jgi:hypothetical protein